MKARIIRSYMSFSEFTIDIPGIPRNGDHISIYCKNCPWVGEGTRDYHQEHVKGCPDTINWFVKGVGFHGNFPKGYKTHKSREVPILVNSVTIYVDDRNPHVWPEIYGLPYDPNDKDLQRWRKKDMDEWEAEAKRLREENEKKNKKEI